MRVCECECVSARRVEREHETIRRERGERGSGHTSKLGLPDSFGHVHKLHEAVARQ